MFEIPDLVVNKDNDYRSKYSVKIGDSNIDIIFSRNDYGVIFISSNIANNPDDSTCVIYIPSALKQNNPGVVNDIERVHPSTPIFFVEDMNETLFSYGMIIGMMSNGAI